MFFIPGTRYLYCVTDEIGISGAPFIFLLHYVIETTWRSIEKCRMTCNCSVSL